MQTAALVLFLLFSLDIAYVYVLYPLFLIVFGSIRRRPDATRLSDDALPTVAVLIPAYNEEKIIARKLETTLAMNYPPAKLRITVVSDRSTDGTDRIVQGIADPRVTFIRNEEQKGKITTLSELAPKADAEIVLITDANAIFEPDAVRRLIEPFQDPRVGIVNGNKVLQRTATMVGEGEGAYWTYETRLKRADSDVFSNAFVTGAMTAIRRELFVPIPGYLEFDHVLPLHAVNQGYRVVFAEGARFHEETAPSSTAEWKVRVRNAVRGFTMVLLMNEYLDVGKHPWFAWHVYSRKVMRWLIGIPACGLLLANLGLLRIALFQLVFAAQILFYLIALLGWFLDRRGIRQGALALPFYFCLVNAASLVGFRRALQGQRMAVWATGR